MYMMKDTNIIFLSSVLISDIQDIRPGAISDTFVKSRRRLPENIHVSKHYTQLCHLCSLLDLFGIICGIFLIFCTR